MRRESWEYYSTGAEDEFVGCVPMTIPVKCCLTDSCYQTLKENITAFQSIRFRPKILVNVEHVDLSTTLLGTKTSIPLYVSATASAKIGHPEGEVVLTRASNTHGIIQMVPSYSSCSLEEMTGARAPDATQWFQLYVGRDRNVAKKAVENAERLGCKALCLTVDNPHLGSRERVLRSQHENDTGDVDEFEDVPATELDQSLTINASLAWEDIPWFQSITKMPIVIKGVQRVEDVLKAIEYGAKAVILSNHGGRQMEYAEAPIEVLAEVMPILRERGLENKIEVYMDGGVRRGTDVLKALCLGARGVGIGRPFLYAMAGYGQKGVEKAMRIFKDELERNMRLIGCNSIDELHQGLVKLLFHDRSRI